MAKKKRALSAYNRHMSREMKKGRTFKQAVASWKGGKSKQTKSVRKRTQRSAPKRTRRRTTTMARKKKTYRRSAALKPSDLAVGAAAYTLAEPMINSLANRVGIGIQDEFVKGGLGYLAYKGKLGKSKMIKGAGVAAMVISVNRLMSGGMGIVATKTGTTALAPTSF